MQILFQYQYKVVFDAAFNYFSVVGNMNSPNKMARYDLYYETHQIDRFIFYLPHFHGDVTRHIGKYLLDITTKELFLKPEKSKSF